MKHLKGFKIFESTLRSKVSYKLVSKNEMGIIEALKWFREYTYQLIIPKKYISDSEKEIWSGEISSSFPIWDPMGSLAI